MTGFVEYVVSELKSKRISRAQALALIKQYSSRSGTGGGGSVIHPLLHRNVSDFSRQGYRTTLDAGQFFLADHRLAGDDQAAVSVLPGVAYLEMARAAIEQATPASERGGVLELHDILWLRPCLVKERQEICIDLELVDSDKGRDSQFEYEMFVEQGEDSVVHCRGRAAYSDSHAPAALDPNSRKAAMQREPLEPEAVYSAFRRLGLHYGPAHQGITALYRGNDEVLATIRLPAVVEAGADEFVLHPSLLDSALQCTLGLVDDLSLHSRPALPFALQTLRIFAPCTRDMWVWVRYAAGSRAGDSLIKLDIDVCDAEGRVCIQMLGFSSREFGASGDAPRRHVSSAEAGDIGPLLARPQWEVATAGPAADRSVLPFEQNHVLVCGWPDREGVEAALKCTSLVFVDAADQARPDARYGEHAVVCFEKVRDVLQRRPNGKVLIQVVAADDGDGRLTAGLSGLLKTAHLENPNLLGQVILVESGTSAERLAAHLQENQARPQDGMIRYRDGRREVLRWQAEASLQQAPQVAFRDNGVYLITGGLGGLGRLFAREILTRTTRGRVILTGRAAPSADTAAQLSSLGEAGRLEYRQVDLARLESVSGLVEAVVKTHGRLDGVLHSAGMIEDNFILKKDVAEFRRVLAPKVTGTVHLDLATRDVDLDFLVLFSSIAGVMGNLGQADYAAANGFMDQFAGYRNRRVAAGTRKGLTVAVAWPVWQDGGMQLDRSAMKRLAETTGLHALQSSIGFASLYRLLELGAERAMVMEGERARLAGSLLAQAGEQPLTEALSPPHDRAGQGPTGDANDLVDKTREFLLKEFSRVLRIPAHKIDSGAALEAYGIDSILAMNLTSQLEKTLGNLPKTLFFEYKSIDELAGYVARAFAQQLTKLLSTAAPAPGSATVTAATVPADAVTTSPRHLRRKTNRSIRRPAAETASPVAVVGLSGRFPNSFDLEEFWDNLSNGRDCITEVPESRWSWRDYCREGGDRGALHSSKWGGFIAGFDEFDPLFFGISPREALYIDPQERLFLQHAWMAIEDAGLSRRTLTGPDDADRRVGVYVGVMYGEYNRSGSLASIANRVSYVLDVHGPSMTLDTMCSSSLTALHLACQDLKQGKTRLALAGGVNLSVYPGKYSMLSAGQFISRDGHCQSFGEGGDGYIPAEGVGVAVLKLLSDAERDGNHIYGVIRGSAINHGGKTNGYTVPNPKSQADAIVRALEDAGVNPRHISYIEAHGTGTRLGDPIEIAALSQAFARHTSDRGYCLIGSVKSNIGHCESAAGMAGLSKVLLQFKHAKIVASLHSTKLNPHIDFDNTPFIVNQSLTQWARPVIDDRECPRIAGISSFGAGGSNAHLIVEEYAAQDLPATIPEGREAAIVLSARTDSQLQDKLADLLAFLERRSPQLDGATGTAFLHDMAHTLQVGREPMEARIGILASSLAELIDKLRRSCSGDADGDVYRANVSAHKATLSGLGNDADFRATVDRWLQQGKLHRLVDLWTKGLTVDWARLHVENTRRLVSLPTYPFARERYWLDVTDQFNPVQPSVATRLHPLVHVNTSSVLEISYESVFTGSEPFLVPVGTDEERSTVLGAATAIEMVMAAVTLAHADQGDRPHMTIRNVQLGEPCWPGPARSITTALFGSVDGQSMFEVASSLDGRETVHVQGLLAADERAPTPVDGEIVCRSNYETSLDETALSQRLPRGGVALQSDRIRYVNAWHSATRALIEIELLGDQSTDGAFLPPGFLHQLISVGATLTGDGALAAQLVFAHEVDSIRFTPERATRVWAVLRFADRESTPDIGRGLDIDLVGHDGHLLLAVRGMRGPSSADHAPVLASVHVEPVREKPRGVELLAPERAQDFGPHGPIRNKPTVELARVTSVSPVVPQGAVRVRAPAPSELNAGAAPSTPRPPAPPNPAQPPAVSRIRDELKASLARALYMEIENVGTDTSFVDLGLDSIVGVEWVKAINEQYGLQVPATRVYDYSNIEQLAAYLRAELEKVGSGDRSGPPAADVDRQTRVERSPEAFAAATSAASAVGAGGPTLVELQEQLRASLARALYVDAAEIDLDKPFAEIGLDSIVGVEWVNAINARYELSLPATRVYDYSTIRELALFLVDQVRTSGPALTGPPSLPAVPARRETVAVPARAERPSTASHGASPRTAFRTLTRIPRGSRTIGRQSAGLLDGRGDPEEKIAIVGASGRYPQARDLEEYWSNLAQGRNAIREVPAFRWDVNQYFDPDPQKPGKVYCKWLGALDDIECFDPLFFQVSPAEAELMDPQHRLFLQEAYRAFEDAGYSDRQLSSTRCGVYLGIMSSEYSYLLSSSSTGVVNTTANSFAIGAARIAYYLNLKGPAIPVDTACSSSLVAIHLARQALLNHEIDMALTGGVSLYLIPEAYQGMCQAGMLSPEGQCKTFDNAANGFVPGEGVGAVVLKRLSDARRDRDHVYGVILASAINQDGKTNGITAPSVNSQIELERDLYSRYRIDPATISYVEAHGTGTKLGDPIELEALATVFGEKTDRKQFCAIGSVKTNIGHASGAAGVASVHKVLLALRHRTIPKTLHFNNENSLFRFADSPFYVARETHAWDHAEDAPRRASISSFGFSGTNAHLVVEEYKPGDAPRASTANGDRSVAILLSARTQEQLRSRAQDLLNYLEKACEDPAYAYDAELADIAYTLQTGRSAMRCRLGFVADSFADAVSRLHAYLDDRAAPDQNGLFRNDMTRAGGVPPLSDATGSAREVEHCLEQRRLPRLIELWVGGAEVDWLALYPAARGPRRVPLPTYPFAKESYWVAPASGRAAVESVAQTAAAELTAEEPARLYYQPIWREWPLTVPSRGTPVEGTVLVLGHEPGFELALQAAAERQGLNLSIIQIRRAGRAEEGESTNQCVLASDDGHGYRRLLDSLEARGMPVAVVHCSPAVPTDSIESRDSIESDLHAEFRSLFLLCQELMRRTLDQPIRIVSTYECADLGRPECSALSGFFRTLVSESTRFKCKLVEFQTTDPRRLLAAEQRASRIVDELAGDSWSEIDVRYRFDGTEPAVTRLIKGLTRFDPAQAPVLGSALRQHGVYLITGGLGGVGFLLAEHLARTYDCSLALVGRSEPSAEQNHKIERLQQSGCRVIYVRADVADKKAVERTIATVKKAFSRIDGVFHCAGSTRDAFVVNKAVEDVEAVLAPKLAGTINLDHATADERLDLFVLFSSGAGIFGNAGQCDYAFANHFLDSFAARRAELGVRGRRSGKTISINWPFWIDGGMEVSEEHLRATEATTGMCALPTAEGLRYLEDFLRVDGPQGIAVYGRPTRTRAYLDQLFRSEQRRTEQVASTLDAALLSRRAVEYLTGLVAEETKLPEDRIDPRESFEAFGFDSIMIGRLNLRMQQGLGELPKTLLYEYPSIEALADYVSKNHGDSLVRHLQMSLEPDAAATPVPARAHLPTARVIADDAALPLDEPIAIIGVHGIYPGSETLDEYWQNLYEGRDLITTVPKDRWDCEQDYDPDPDRASLGKIYCKWGGFLEGVERFDPHFFNVDPREASIIDPQERWFLQSVWSVMEDAGYTRDEMKARWPSGKGARVGVFVGVTSNTYHLIGPEQWSHGNPVTPSSLPWSIANRVSYYFDFHGPSMPVDTACSSSLVAIHMACESLRKQECQVAVAGGVNFYLHRTKYHSLCQRRMLSTDGRCHSFGAGGDGFVPGEGVGCVMLKPLSRAIADSDHVYAVIRGTAVQHSGRSSSYSAPNPTSQAALISRLLESTATHPESISLVEGHGTGTELGDSLEVLALSQAFRQQTQRKGFCAIGSVKSNIGHSESAAGIAGLTKLMLQMKHRTLVPTVQCARPNEGIDFDSSPFVLQRALQPWDHDPASPRRALLNSFGAGGVNACLLLEEHLPGAGIPLARNGMSLVVLSAKNADRLNARIRQLAEYVRSHPETDLARLACTLQLGRESMQERLAVVAGDTHELLSKLARFEHGQSDGDVFRGSVLPGKRADDGGDHREHADADLHTLADAWVNGRPVTWERIYPDGRLPRLPLPTYPFAPERYWVSEVEPARSARLLPKVPSSLHPLITSRLSGSETTGFSSILHKDAFYATDHRVGGRCVFPGAGFLEMALICGNLAGERRVTSIRDIVWINPLEFDHGNRTVRTLLRTTGDGIEFEIVGIGSQGDGGAVVHCEGKLVVEDAAAPAHQPREIWSVEALLQQTGAPRSSESCYQAFREAGLDYGPAFRTVTQFAAQGDVAISRLQIPDVLGDACDEYCLHPSMLDGALQTVIGLLGEEDESALYLPFALEQLELSAPIPRSCLAHVERIEPRAAGRSGVARFNIRLLSERGTVLASLKNFAIRKQVVQLPGRSERIDTVAAV